MESYESRRCRDRYTLDVLIGSLILVGCADITPSGPGQAPGRTDWGPPGPAFASLNRAPRNIHERFLQLASEIPGFGGLYQSSEGEIVVYLTDLAQSPRAVQAIDALFATSARAPSRPQVRVSPARFSYEQLAEWYRELLPLTANVTITDIDERNNRILIGVSDITAATEIRAAADGRGIPVEAVIIEEIPPVKLSTALDDKQRPLIGGLRIYAVGQCTQGYNVRLQSQSTGLEDGYDYFLTAGHCTGSLGVNDTIVFGQPTLSDPVGEEYSDPPFREPSGQWWDLCPDSIASQCRDSDSALVKVGSGVSVRQGYIAVTNGGNLTITGQRPMVGIEGWIFTGLPVSKVGASTGTTSGQILSTCVNVHLADTVHVCQHTASYSAGGGDSGAPVFHVDSNDDYWVLGIHWGINTAHGYSIYSPWDAIASEIEADIYSTYGNAVTMLITPPPPPPPPPLTVEIDGPTYVEPNTFCEWHARPSGGSGGYSYDWYVDDNWVSSYYAYFDTVDSNFALKVVVTDSSNDTAYDEISVMEDSGVSGCGS